MERGVTDIMAETEIESIGEGLGQGQGSIIEAGETGPDRGREVEIGGLEEDVTPTMSSDEEDISVIAAARLAGADMIETIETNATEEMTTTNENNVATDFDPSQG